MQKVIIGTELKLNVSIDKIGSFTMSNYEFEVEIMSTGMSRKSVVISKSESVKIDDNNYVVCFDTKDLGQGRIKCRVTAHLPDADFKDGYRTEVAEVNTDIELIKGI